MRPARRAAVAIAAGTLLTGLAVHGTATATAPVTEEAARTLSVTAPAQADTLREAAAEQGRFIGTALNDALLGNSAYTAIAGGEFSSVTAENAMKWGSLESTRGQYNWAGADRLVEFAAANDQQVYGHTLVWHSQLPGWVENGGFAPAELREIVDNHIATVAGRYAGSIDRWDVVNEAFNENGTFRDTVFLRAFGERYIADAFHAAHAADPGAKLFINDYNTDGINAKSDAMYRLVSSLLADGVPVHGVGFQSHMILGQMPASYRANLQRFSDLGLEVAVTELDIRMNTPADPTRLDRQADQYRQVVDDCLAVSGCSGVTVWGISDRDSWIPGVFPGEGAANLYDDDYRPKPAYWAVLDAFGGAPGPDPTDPDPTDPDPTDPDPTDPTDPGTPAGCTASYRVLNSWGGGSVVEVSVTTTTALSGWQARFTLPSGARVTNGWNAVFATGGGAVTASHVAHNRVVPAGGTVTFGFQADTGAHAAPAVALNGAECARS
ncbi:endo-1,4-beta-xylanase [Streptomyces lonarensis]|uniref:Beta-xylanase n=1 Tax=Streptomyces lonarensis TaxID=700599 RepID=A0A7X6D050_9ACTN|nr:endo-1,4-beta-xylanase [Streptomyces lonarensis]NJQ05754.1 endo-1,4-beta-xylanase [Streptomyces lonarensis]